MPVHERDLGSALRAYRIRARINQHDLARIVGVSQSQISRWESGRDSPRAANAETIRALVYGRPDPQLLALVHLVETTSAAMALYDAEDNLIVASRNLAHPGGPFRQWGWLFDPGAHPAFAPVYRRYRAILARPEGTVGLRIRVPFRVGEDPWCAESRRTILLAGGSGVCLAEIAFLPDPDPVSAEPSLERLAPGPEALRALRRTRVLQPVLGS